MSIRRFARRKLLQLAGVNPSLVERQGAAVPPARDDAHVACKEKPMAEAAKAPVQAPSPASVGAASNAPALVSNVLAPEVDPEALEAHKRMLQQTAAMFRLKRMEVRVAAAAIGAPFDNVRRALMGELEAIRAMDWEKLMDVCGIDRASGQLRADFPHFIYVGKGMQADIACIGPMLEDALAVRVRPVMPARRPFRRAIATRVLVLQNTRLRLVCIEEDRISLMKQSTVCQWARKTEKDSEIACDIPLERFVAGDLTANEFDGLFDLDRKNTWERVMLIARAQHVSITEIIDFIHQRGHEKDALLVERPIVQPQLVSAQPMDEVPAEKAA